MQRPQGQSRGQSEAASSTFCDVAGQLCQEMVAQLASEHTNETKKLFDEVVTLRGEMSNVQDLLGGYLEREQVLSEMMQMMQQNFQATQGLVQDLHGKFQSHADGHMKDHADQQRLMGDPKKDAQNELARITQILSQPAVPPPEVPAHLHQVQKQGGRIF